MNQSHPTVSRTSKLNMLHPANHLNRQVLWPAANKESEWRQFDEDVDDP